MTHNYFQVHFSVPLPRPMPRIHPLLCHDCLIGVASLLLQRDWKRSEWRGGVLSLGALHSLARAAFSAAYRPHSHVLRKPDRAMQ